MKEFKDNKYITIRMETYNELRRKEELLSKIDKNDTIKITVNDKNYYMDLDDCKTLDQFYGKFLQWDPWRDYDNERRNKENPATV